MASSLRTAKQAVDLAAPAVRVSRVRRDPPPAVKEISIHDRDERNRRTVVIGVAAFAMAIAIIIIGVSSFVVGWKPSEYTIHM